MASVGSVIQLNVIAALGAVGTAVPFGNTKYFLVLVVCLAHFDNLRAKLELKNPNESIKLVCQD